jgi:hypothetical protein
MAPGDLRHGVFLAAIMNRRPDASVTPMTDLANVETLYRSLLARWERTRRRGIRGAVRDGWKSCGV